jgi:hypothetical protein
MSRAPSRGVSKDGEGTGWFGTRASVRTMREGMWLSGGEVRMHSSSWPGLPRP